jgi:hypothetical protein
MPRRLCRGFSYCRVESFKAENSTGLNGVSQSRPESTRVSQSQSESTSSASAIFSSDLTLVPTNLLLDGLTRSKLHSLALNIFLGNKPVAERPPAGTWIMPSVKIGLDPSSRTNVTRDQESVNVFHKTNFGKVFRDACQQHTSSQISSKL